MKHKVEKILEGLTTSQRNLVIVKLVFHLAWYRIRRIGRRARFHWIGNQRQRRYERLLIPAMYVGGMLFFDGRDFAIWSMYVGGVASIFVVLYSIFRLVPIKTEHWIGRKP